MNVVDWLLEGDPAIRWQTKRDLLEAPEVEWQAERLQVAETGWGADFLSALSPDDTWLSGGWRSGLWTLHNLVELGVSAEHPRTKLAAHKMLNERDWDETYLLTKLDHCHLGLLLRIGAYFGFDEARLQILINLIESLPLSDGGFNCRARRLPKTKHSSFHTTFNMLEGLREANLAGILPTDRFRRLEAPALEFMLMHRMYRSDRSGEVVKEAFTRLTYPSHWHYRVVRGLDYLRHCAEIHDPRIEDPIQMLTARQGSDGRWLLDARIAGDEYFHMERTNAPSRWNTLRMMRVLRARRGSATSS